MKRNRNLDFLKTVCSFLVVCIHAPFPGIAGTIFLPLCRIAVPLFFMITGYYYTHTKQRNNEKKQLMKILRLFVGANLLFFLWSLLWKCICGYSVVGYLSSAFSLTSIGKFLLLNESPFGGHLWYLGAILYVLVIIFVFEKKWDRKKMYPVVPVLLLADLVFGKYSLLLFGQSIPFIWFRNFLCVGLPYFLIGDMLYTYRITVKPKKALLLALVFVLTTFAERFVLGFFEVNGQRDHYISTTFLASFLFLSATQCSSECICKGYRALCEIGAKLSTGIYVMHPIFITLLLALIDHLCRYIPQLFVYYYIEPIAVFVCTAIVAWGVHLFTTVLKRKLSTARNT